MNERSLADFVELLNRDSAFRQAVKEDPNAHLFGNGSALAIVQVDQEDAFRRLASGTAPENARIWTWIKKKASALFCGPGKTRSWECKNQPGSS